MHKCLGILFANEWTSPSKLYERYVCWKQFDVEHALNCREETVITKWHNGMWSIKVKSLSEVTNAIELNIIIAGFIFIYLLFIYLFIYLLIYLFIGIHSTECRTANTRHRVTRKRSTKRLKHTGNQFRKNLQLKDVC